MGQGVERAASIDTGVTDSLLPDSPIAEALGRFLLVKLADFFQERTRRAT